VKRAGRLLARRPATSTHDATHITHECSSTESTYIVSLSELVWGGILVAVTLVMHGFGMLATLRCTGSFKQRFGRTPSLTGSMGNLILGSWLITFVHLTEVLLWACFFQWNRCFENFSTAGYFALMEYTTIGSQFNLPQRWRLLEGMIGTAGLIGFAWSTGVLMTLAQAFQDQQMQRPGKHGRAPAKAATSENNPNH
jgi:hypothetical protein